MSVANNLGKRFGRLLVISRAPQLLWRDSHRVEWLCECDCGGLTFRQGRALAGGNAKSCGCLLARSERNSYPRSGAYRSWLNMRVRCLNERHSAYRYYGGRGISVCARWESFANFLADMGERPAGTSIDRIDVNGDYEPTNCRWATKSEQAINRRPRVAATNP